eukprot:TRINITY_DN3951_c0_g2_i1.p2 TRINITY_DN3951_c0_g2~~TRINITY_DN3951_c0_g2_i1.p2  ORF type:complete len:480 (+),score=188.84 TRINITY_DN3951_c0_g2_i1:63-1502(+)
MTATEESTPPMTTGQIMFQFCLMTVFFALNHGTVTAVIPLASPEFGDLGDVANGTLYGFYTLTALFASTLIVEKLGQKFALLAGCGVYTLYILGNLAGVLTHGWVRTVIVIVAGAFGGMAAGFLWTAQGGYFANAAKAYAAAIGEEDVKQVTAKFSAVFASVYLAMEVLIKVSSSLVVYGVCKDHWHGSFLTGKCGGGAGDDASVVDHVKWKGIVITYAVFSCIAVVSTVGMLCIRSFEAPAPPPADAESAPLLAAPVKKPTEWSRKALAAVELMRRRPEILLVGIFNLQFGVTSSYLNSYVTGTIIGGGPLGKDKVGYFTAIIPLVAAAFAFPLSWITTALKGDKTAGMMIGMLSWLAFALVFLGTDLTHYHEADALTNELGTWGALVPLFVVFGIGRSCWESINKAVFADMFKDDTEAAFAVLIVQLGLTSTATFIGYRFLGNLPKEVIMSAMGVLAVVGYFAGVSISKKRAQEEAP